MRGAASTRAPARLFRASALATSSALLTAIGHLAGGGTVPDLAMLVVLLPLLTAVLLSVAQRCRSLPGTIAILGAGQLALHELLTLLHPADAHNAPAVAMVAAHTAVTLVIAVALRHADAAVSAVLAALARLVPRRLAPLPARRPLRVFVQAPAELAARIAALMARTHAHRGPPVGC